MAGRKSRFKRSDIEIRQWFLEHLVDSNGNKVSLRDLWWSDEFIEFSGMTGERTGKKSSNGTLSYWVYKKWGLSDEYIYNYHKNITFKINNEITFEEWHNINMGGKGKEKFTLDAYDENYAKKAINYIFKNIGERYRLDEYSPIAPYWDMLLLSNHYLYKEKELIVKFKNLYKKLKVGESIGK